MRRVNDAIIGIILIKWYSVVVTAAHIWACVF